MNQRDLNTVSLEHLEAMAEAANYHKDEISKFADKYGFVIDWEDKTARKMQITKNTKPLIQKRVSTEDSFSRKHTSPNNQELSDVPDVKSLVIELKSGNHKILVSFLKHHLNNAGPIFLKDLTTGLRSIHSNNGKVNAQIIIAQTRIKKILNPRKSKAKK